MFGPTLVEQVVGPDSQALVKSVERDYATVLQQSALPAGAAVQGGRLELLGYRIAGGSSGVRQVTLVERAPDANGVGQTYEVAVDVQWVDGDWRLVAPRDGRWENAFTWLDVAPQPYLVFGGA
ncbi:hypothetical protein [Vallicoccus soli]|uniref:hypothetical protein n=1 Tax=Vallicoccus soli TaxID=2339232 RepID=UPI0010597AA2|nr:hypothetical protein [Vallicoccus soli]